MDRIRRAYEKYLKTPRGEKGRVLSELARKLRMSESKLRRIFRERYGKRRRVRKSPTSYSRDDILYAIHFSRKKGVSLLYACSHLVRSRKVVRRSYEEVKDPVRAFYLAVIRFIRSSNSNVPKGKKVGKTALKRALLGSDMSESEKFLITMAMDGLLTTSSPLSGEQEKVLISLLKRGYPSLRRGKYFITPKLKYEILGDGLP